MRFTITQEMIDKSYRAEDCPVERAMKEILPTKNLCASVWYLSYRPLKHLPREFHNWNSIGLGRVADWLDRYYDSMYDRDIEVKPFTFNISAESLMAFTDHS